MEFSSSFCLVILFTTCRSYLTFMPLYLTASTSAVIAILYSIYLIEWKLKKLWKLTAVMSQIEGCFCYFGACLLAASFISCPKMFKFIS